MLRRDLLLAGGATLVGLGGCRLSDPTVQGSPRPPYTPPPPTPLPGSQDVAALERAAWSALLSAAAAPGTDASSLTRLAAIRAAHVGVLTTPEPLWRRAATPPAPPTVAPAASRDAGVAAAHAALVALGEATVTRAVAEEGPLAALWASLAASAGQARLWLGAVPGGVVAAVPGRVVVRKPDAEAFATLLERYHEATYGFSSLLGFLPARHALRPAVASVLSATRTRRDALMAYDRAASATPTPGAGAYSVPPATPDQVPAVAAALLTSITGAAGVWVASATTERRRRAVDELVCAAGAGLPVNAGLAEWPGWPDGT